MIFANNDLEFIQKDFVKRIYEEYQNSKFAVLGPDIYNPIIDTHQSPISYEMQRSKSNVKNNNIFNRLALNYYDLYNMFFSYLVLPKYCAINFSRNTKTHKNGAHSFPILTFLNIHNTKNATDVDYKNPMVYF